MTKTVVLGVVIGVLGLGGSALAQTQKAPEAVAAQMGAEPKAGPEGLVKLLESKGVLTETEAAMVSEAALQPQAKLVLAEMLLSKHLITEKEYDHTIEACSSTAAQATPTAAPGSERIGGRHAARPVFGWGEGGGVPMSLSDRIASILPGGTEASTDLAFGTIEPGPPLYYPGQDEPRPARAKDKHKSKKHHRQNAPQKASGSAESAPQQ